MSVVEFQPKPNPKDLAVVCDCGSVTWYMLSSGDLECSVCNSLLTDDLSGVDHSKIKEVDVEVTKYHKMPTEEFAIRRTISQAKQGITAAIVVMNKDGHTHVWSEGANGNQEIVDWFQKRVDEMMDQLV